MAKPTTVPGWNTDGSNRTNPGAGKRATGWAPGERPPANYFNWLLHWLGAWAEYLDAGALEGDHSIDGALDVTGGVTSAGTIHADGDLTADGEITAGSGRNVVVTGNGDFVHGDKVLTIPAMGTVTGSVAWNFGALYLAAAAAGTCLVPLPFKVGDRLKTITGRIFGNGATHITVRIVVLNGNGSAAINGGGVAGAQPAAAWETSDTDDGSLDHLLAPNQAAYALIDFDGSGRCQTLSITYDRPPAGV